MASYIRGLVAYCSTMYNGKCERRSGRAAMSRCAEPEGRPGKTRNWPLSFSGEAVVERASKRGVKQGGQAAQQGLGSDDWRPRRRRETWVVVAAAAKAKAKAKAAGREQTKRGRRRKTIAPCRCSAAVNRWNYGRRILEFGILCTKVSFELLFSVVGRWTGTVDSSSAPARNCASPTEEIPLVPPFWCFSVLFLPFFFGRARRRRKGAAAARGRAPRPEESPGASPDPSAGDDGANASELQRRTERGRASRVKSVQFICIRRDVSLYVIDEGMFLQNRTAASFVCVRASCRFLMASRRGKAQRFLRLPPPRRGVGTGEGGVCKCVRYVSLNDRMDNLNGIARGRIRRCFCRPALTSLGKV